MNLSYFSEDTIAAIATAVGGALTIVRVSGPAAFSSLQKLASNKHALKHAYLQRTELSFSDGPDRKKLDDALVVSFANPKSFTGEDLVEYHLHGSPYIAKRLVETLMQAGIRQALPGEFSFRAVRNGKMNLFQAESIADLIAARNDEAVSLALEKLSGLEAPWIEALKNEMRQLASHSELGIDFSDQDIEELSLPVLKKRASDLLPRLQQLAASFDRGERIQEGVRVVFAGAPNSGKSSFFNQLLGEERSIVSDVAGTTRDLVREHATLRTKTGSVTLKLEDTAGLRTTSDEIERQGIERTRAAARRADFILWVVDVTQAPELIKSFWSSFGTFLANKKIVGILNKCDLNPPSQDLMTVLKEVTPQWFAVSSKTGEGVLPAIDAIVSTCSEWTHRDAGEVLLTRLNHYQAVVSAIEHLERALTATGIDFFASDMRQSLIALSPVIGETLPDDILEKIFSNFCIGK